MVSQLSLKSNRLLVMKFPVRMRSRFSPSSNDPGLPIVSNNPAAPAIEGTNVGNEHNIKPNALQAYLIKKSSNMLYATRTCHQFSIIVRDTLYMPFICFINLVNVLFNTPISISAPL
jgi:hypothetical protein